MDNAAKKFAEHTGRKLKITKFSRFFINCTLVIVPAAARTIYLTTCCCCFSSAEDKISVTRSAKPGMRTRGGERKRNWKTERLRIRSFCTCAHTQGIGVCVCVRTQFMLITDSDWQWLWPLLLMGSLSLSPLLWLFLSARDYVCSEQFVRT